MNPCIVLDRTERKAGDCRIMEVWVNSVTRKVAMRKIVGYKHAPYPISKRDRHGNFDIVKCRRCGKSLLGSFV